METIECANGNTVHYFVASTPQGRRGIVQIWRESALWVTIPTYDFCTAQVVAKLLADDYNKQQMSSEFVVNNEALVALVANGKPGPEFR